MDKKVTLIFEHKKDKDQITEVYTMKELIYGIGTTSQPVREIVDALKEDGYILVDTVVAEDIDKRKEKNLIQQVREKSISLEEMAKGIGMSTEEFVKKLEENKHIY